MASNSSGVGSGALRRTGVSFLEELKVKQQNERRTQRKGEVSVNKKEKVGWGIH